MEEEYLPKVDPQTGVRTYVFMVAILCRGLECKTYFLQFFLCSVLSTALASANVYFSFSYSCYSPFLTAAIFSFSYSCCFLTAAILLFLQLLMHYVDDFLLLTQDPNMAKTFLDTMTKGTSKYTGEQYFSGWGAKGGNLPPPENDFTCPP